MAALQPSAEGQGLSPTKKKSFSQLFSQPATSPIHIQQASVYKGEAAVVFSKADADKLAAPFQWALVGKFSHGRPSLEDIRKFFASLNLKDHVSIGLMDYRHVLIKCMAEADFNRIWMRGIWQLGKYPMRVFRWTREFHVLRESSLAPVWVVLPALPIHYFDKHSLFSILSPVGRPLFLDSATAAGTRPSLARVCVELDVAKSFTQRVWVAVEGESGFWQRIVPENMPLYCSSCSRLGHSQEQCKKNVTEVGSRYLYKHNSKLQRDLSLEVNNVQVSNLDLVKNPDANLEKTTDVVTESDEVQRTEMGNYAEKLKGAVVEEVCTATKVQEVSKPDDHLIKLGVTKLSSSAGFEQPQNDLAMERREMENQLEMVHGNDVQGNLNTAHMREQALVGEQLIMQRHLEQVHGNDEGTQATSSEASKEKLQSMADNNSLEHLYVELRGVENFGPTEHGIVEVNSPTNCCRKFVNHHLLNFHFKLVSFIFHEFFLVPYLTVRPP
ncbi:unnamed protein product [Coffea canephora]|uniref:DH200=94 genomic scaffold, scaffold_2060 n=1 Tax=Coffea canephora TaxID=49390 RepID=A0A068VJB8_COFCA|nr:unnamed protein product [Coffea canephora]